MKTNTIDKQGAKSMASSKLTPRQIKVYKGIIKKYIGDAEKHFQRCKLVPDNEDLAGCICDFWDQDSPVDVEEWQYNNLLSVMTKRA
jgi:hypothetical protein